MEKIIYIVEGSTGEWEDSYSWNVKGFFNKETAEELCLKLNTIAQKANAGNFGDDWDERMNNSEAMYKVQAEVETELQVLDPSASVNFPGTNYSIKELILEVD